MKGYGLYLGIIVLLTVICGSLQARHEMIDIYQKDYEIANRTVLVLTSKPNFLVEQNTDQKKLIITMKQTSKRDHIPQVQQISGSIIETIAVADGRAGELVVTITTTIPYFLDYFELRGQDHRVVFDIYSVKEPATEREITAFAKFYTSVGFYARAEKLFEEVTKANPELTAIYYYWGLIHQSRGESNFAADYFQKVRFIEPEYLLAQTELWKMGIIEIEYDDEIERVFSYYRDNFLRAGSIERQTFILALSGSIYGNYDVFKEHISSLDFNSEELGLMLTNINSIYEQILTDKDLSSRQPILYNFVSNISAQRKGLSIIYLAIAVLVAIILTFLITRTLMLKKLQGKDEVENEYLSEPVVDKEPDSEPIESEPELPEENEPVSEDFPPESLDESETFMRKEPDSEPIESEPELPEENEVVTEDIPIESLDESEIFKRKEPELTDELESTDNREEEEEGDSLATEENKEDNPTDFSPEIKNATLDEDAYITLSSGEMKHRKALELYNDGWEIDEICKKVGLARAEIEIYIKKVISGVFTAEPQSTVSFAKEPELAQEIAEKKEEKKEVINDSTTYSENDINIKLAVKLYQDGWNVYAIAHELNMDIEKVKEIIYDSGE